MTPSLLDAALSYHALGRPVIPVQADKRPACEAWGRWRYEAQTESEVQELFSRPVHGLALLTWPGSDLMVLDFDGPHAEQTWKEKTGIPLPDTATNRTRSGWVHRIYLTPKDTPRPDRNTIEQGPRRKIRLAVNPECGCEKPCGVDLLLNGYFLVPPSPGYAEDPDAPCEPGSIATIPQAVLTLARDSERENGDGNGRPVTPGAPVLHGERNATLASLAGSMRRRGMTGSAILAALVEENALRCTPPLPEREVRDIARSISRYPPAAANTKGSEPGAPGEAQQEAPPAEVSRDGDDFTYTWVPLGLEVRATRLRDGGEGVHGEIGISLDGRPLHWGRANLASLSAREGLVTKLNRIRPKIPWRDILEEVCRETAEQLRAGAPTVQLVPARGTVERRLVDKLLLDGETNVVFSDGGAGKSFLALAIAVAVATGKPLPAGLTPRRSGPVLYLDWESIEAEHQERLAGLLSGLGVSAPVPIFYRRMVGALADEAPTLRAEVARCGAVLVIADSLGPACGAEPEGADAAIRALNALRSIAPARLVLAHVSKLHADQKGATRPFGSVYVMNLPRNVWELRKGEEDEGDTLTIGAYHRKTNRGRLLPPFALRFEFGENGTRLQAADIGQDTGLRGRAGPGYAILGALRPGAKTIGELAEELEASEQSVKQALYRLEKTGKVVRVGDPGHGPGRPVRWGLKA
jgi:hypothetical protein